METTGNPDSCCSLEIGCGTGVASVFLAKELQHRGVSRCIHYVTDINPLALKATQATAKANDISTIEAVQCDLASSLLAKLEGSVDVLIFNPPYVPTPDDEVGSVGIEASWAGGENGRRVIDRALPQIAQLLRKPNGVAFLVTVDENQPEDLKRIFEQDYGCTLKPWVRRRARNEYLTIQRIVAST